MHRPPSPSGSPKPRFRHQRRGNGEGCWCSSCLRWTQARPQAQTGNHGQQFSNGLGWGIPVWEYPAPASMLCAKAGSGSCHHVGGDCDEDSVDTVDSFISTCTFGNW